MTKSSEPSVTKFGVTKGANQLTGNSHQRAGDIGIWTEPKWADVVFWGILTIHGQISLDIRSCEVQEVDHVVRNGTVQLLEGLRTPVFRRKTTYIRRVRRCKRDLGCHGGE